MHLAVNSQETSQVREQKSEIQDNDVDDESSVVVPPPQLSLSLSPFLSADGRSVAQLLSAAYKKCCAFKQGF